MIPKLTEDAALEFVKLIHTGISPALAVIYMVPTIANSELTDAEKDQLASDVAARWYKTPLLFDAINTFNGGQWQELAPERRLSITRDKAYAELAHFLYSHDYATLDGVELKKYLEALAHIDERLKGSEGIDSPFEKAMRDIAAKMKEAPQALAARMQPVAKTTQ